jgi:hypothetical protein
MAHTKYLYFAKLCRAQCDIETAKVEERHANHYRETLGGLSV